MRSKGRTHAEQSVNLNPSKGSMMSNAQELMHARSSLRAEGTPMPESDSLAKSSLTYETHITPATPS